jgi:dihydropteroate synthase-like protein
MSGDSSIHFVTGKLAEAALREVVASLATKLHFNYTIDVLPITVAALMTPKWVLKHIQIPPGTTRVVLPGYLSNGLDEMRSALDPSILVECGPKDVRDLPVMFGRKRHIGSDYGQHSIEIIAEINYAPRLTREELIRLAKKHINEGADRIDLGCEPAVRWSDMADSIKAIRDLGIALSIDTFDTWEAATAVKAGVSLVLSVNSSNRDHAVDWGVEVVVVPELNGDYLASLEQTADFLSRKGVPFRLDPILEPIGCGFSKSLERYLRTRDYFPEASMLMGIGNLTELTDVDSAGVNVLLLGICEELQIRSVLTTEVISWAKSSIRECAIARALVNYAVRHRIPPKHLEERLIMLRDPKSSSYSDSSIAQLATAIKDNNYRILIDDSQIHLLSANVHIRGTDPFAMMQELMTLPQSRNVDASHAFYLGFELSKAMTALTLGKRYEQDEALRWGMHTRPEKHHRLARSKKRTENLPSNDPATE